MPKSRKRGQKAGPKVTSGGSRQTTDDEYDTADNWSTASVLSDDGSWAGSGGGDVATECDETSAQELFEDRLKEWLEGTSQKSAQGRKTCLEGIRKAFAKKYLNEFLQDRKETVADALEKCLRKGKGDEQALAASCISLLMIQLGLDATDLLENIHPTLLTILTDNSALLKAREQCAVTLGMCIFLLDDGGDTTRTVMKALADIFKASFLKGDHSTPKHTTEVCSLHAHALEAWCLLLTLQPSYVAAELTNSYLGKLPELLNSADVDLRIAAGEAIALMYEMARTKDEDFENDDIEDLCQSLKELATDSQKHRSKKDRKQQRSSFRDILRSVEYGEAPEFTIKFGIETLDIDSWVLKKRYDAFCDALESGMNHHLQENSLVREVFALGPPIPAEAKVQTKLSKFERNMYKAAAFKARTKVRSKQRDKRAVTVNGC